MPDPCPSLPPPPPPQALAEATGLKEASIKKSLEAEGDLGSVAVSCRATQKTMFTPAPLTIASVFKAFKEIAASSGSKSMERKKGMIVKLLVSSKGVEAGYIMRSLQVILPLGGGGGCSRLCQDFLLRAC